MFNFLETMESQIRSLIKSRLVLWCEKISWMICWWWCVKRQFMFGILFDYFLKDPISNKINNSKSWIVQCEQYICCEFDKSSSLVIFITWLNLYTKCIYINSTLFHYWTDDDNETPRKTIHELFTRCYCNRCDHFYSILKII